MKLSPKEVLLNGSIIENDGRLEFDPIALRIKVLCDTYLKKVAIDGSGWETLYIDPTDKRFWELTYPDNEIHGGGAPALKNISMLEAKSKYNI